MKINFDEIFLPVKEEKNGGLFDVYAKDKEHYLGKDTLNNDDITTLFIYLEQHPKATLLKLTEFNFENIHTLATALSTNKTITTCNLPSNWFNDEDAAAIAKALEVNRTITRWSLENNMIGGKGAVAIAKALANNYTITECNLRFNSIGDEGATAIAKALEHNYTITECNLGINSIGNEGATAIAKAIENNRSITICNLAGNRIGDEGATAIAKALKNNHSITLCNLAYNKIGDKGATAIAKALKNNCSITACDLEYNRIGDEGTTAIAKALESNRTITELSLLGNKIDDKGLTALANAFKVNTTIINFLNVDGKNNTSHPVKKIIEYIQFCCVDNKDKAIYHLKKISKYIKRNRNKLMQKSILPILLDHANGGAGEANIYAYIIDYLKDWNLTADPKVDSKILKEVAKEGQDLQKKALLLLRGIKNILELYKNNLQRNAGQILDPSRSKIIEKITSELTRAEDNKSYILHALAMIKTLLASPNQNQQEKELCDKILEKFTEKKQANEIQTFSSLINGEEKAPSSIPNKAITWPSSDESYKKLPEQQKSGLLQQENYNFFKKNVFDIIDKQIARLKNTNKADQLVTVRNDLCNTLTQELRQESSLPKTCETLYKKITSQATQRKINLQRNMLGAFLKGLAGTLLAATCVFLPFFSRNFRDIFFKTATGKEFTKIEEKLEKLENEKRFK